jgi:hypothetical protein
MPCTIHATTIIFSTASSNSTPTIPTIIPQNPTETPFFSGGIAITEVMAAPCGVDAKVEYVNENIELYNHSDMTMDVRGLFIYVLAPRAGGADEVEVEFALVDMKGRCDFDHALVYPPFLLGGRREPFSLLFKDKTGLGIVSFRFYITALKSG